MEYGNILSRAVNVVWQNKYLMHSRHFGFAGQVARSAVSAVAAVETATTSPLESRDNFPKNFLKSERQSPALRWSRFLP